ncbi:monoheme c-type cytochrome [Malaciobacter marinus]|uniref:Monoheme c-type cytochrome n=1 Tax=Malaciobacter marinus TaxID=505249 RepID=A0A347TMQ8_9BACT|nr:hypothetical protein [Malaciobacter marinus]AXX87886.1 monoheme c-type cytochrome [Malaciobacter marinus]PHO15409.1 hypothetical protein CPH92_07045 [Malaciobacter marinus]
MKKVLLIFSTILIIFTGCEDKKDIDDKKIKNNNTPKIKIIEGKDKIKNENPFITYDLDGNKKIKVSPDGVETDLTKEIGALSTIRNSYENLNNRILAKTLSKNYIVKCSACHDDYANGVIGPSLIQKSEKEITNMIKAYKNKTKVNELMKYLVSQMDDEEIKSLAKEISNLNKEVQRQKNEN